MRKRFPLALGLAAGLALIPGAALAHHPEVEADQNCDGTVTWSAEAWANDDPDRRVNHRIEIRVFGAGLPAEGKVIKIGEFTEDNDYAFGGSHRLDEPGEVTVRATSLVRWGEDEDRGDLNEFREATAEPDESCDGDESSATTTTVGAEVVDVTPTDVSGAVTDSPTVASPEAVAARGATAAELPFTGGTTVPLLIAGLVLLVSGIWILRNGRRRAGQSD